jgi:hypothetical protein
VREKSKSRCSRLLKSSLTSIYMNFQSKDPIMGFWGFGVLGTFIVLDGFGTIVSGDIYHQVKPGDVVTIPPQTDHWMIPNPDHRLTGILWYHTSPTRHSK